MREELSVTLRIGGDISVSDFAERAELWSNVLSELTKETGSRIRWIISDLEYSSAIMTAAPIAEDEQAERFIPQVVDGYLNAARDLRAGRFDPDRPALRVVRDLVEKATPEADITFETPEDEVTFEGAPETLLMLEPVTENPPALGTVRGRVETLSQRRGLRFTLYDLRADRAVSCYIEPGQEEQLRNIWGRLADVTGMVRRDPKSDRPVSVRKVSSIELVPDPVPGAFLKARGAVVPADDAPSAANIIRQLRDAG